MDALRRDLLAEKAPISVTSVKPATINTPLFANSRSKLGVFPKGPPPLYQPEVVAKCVAYAAEHPVRDLYAGGAGRVMALQQFVSPRQMDLYLSKIGIRQERAPEKNEVDAQTDGPRDNVDEPRPQDNRTRGDFSGRAKRFSLYTWIQTHPKSRAAVQSVALAAPLVLSRLRGTEALPPSATKVDPAVKVRAVPMRGVTGAAQGRRAARVKDARSRPTIRRSR